MAVAPALDPGERLVLGIINQNYSILQETYVNIFVQPTSMDPIDPVSTPDRIHLIHLDRPCAAHLGINTRLVPACSKGCLKWSGCMLPMAHGPPSKTLISTRIQRAVAARAGRIGFKPSPPLPLSYRMYFPNVAD